jgi:hypothetical protein
MSDAVTVAVITGLCTSLAPVALSILNRIKLREYHLQINSRLDELIKAKEAAAHARGMSDQKQVATDEAAGQTERHG